MAHSVPHILLEDYDVSHGTLDDVKKNETDVKPEIIKTSHSNNSLKCSAHISRRNYKLNKSKYIHVRDLPRDCSKWRERSHTIGTGNELHRKLSSGLEKIMLRQYSATTPDTDDSDSELSSRDSRMSQLQLPGEEDFFRSRAHTNPSPEMRRRRLCRTQHMQSSDTELTPQCTCDAGTDESGGTSCEEDFGVPVQRDRSKSDAHTSKEAR